MAAPPATSRRAALDTIARLLLGVGCAIVVPFEPASAQSTREAAAGPRGIFALSQGREALPDWVLADPVVTGVSLRVGWSDVEAREGTYTWPFDAEIERAVKAGKTVMLRVTPDYRTPAWVYGAGAAKFEFVDASRHHAAQGTSLTIPVPWDPVFLARWKQFVRTMGGRYASNETVVLVHLTGPSGAGAEMHLPKRPEDKERWTRIGYSKSRLTGAWHEVVDAYAAAFATQSLALNVATPIWSDGVLEDVVAYGSRKLGHRFAVQHNALSAKMKRDWPVHRLVASLKGRGTVGFQLLSPVTPRGRFNEEGQRFGGTMEQAMKTALDAGGTYVEIYPVDLKNPPAAQAIRHFAERVSN
jgi:hypothetical protein